MNIFKVFSHPYTLIFSFLFILISGEHLGGFYALYIFLGLTHGLIHSLLGFFGIVILLIGYHLNAKFRIKQGLNIVGVLMLIASVFLFFYNDKLHYNWGTFEQGFPVLTLICAFLISVCFIIGTFWKLPSKELNKRSLLSKV